MDKSKFVYITYIRTNPESLWLALTDPGFIRQYFYGITQDSEWKPGSSWRLLTPGGAVGDTGEVVEIVPPKRIVLKWRNEFQPEFKAEGYSRMAYEIEKARTSVKLTVTHEMDVAGSKFIASVAGAWPLIISSLKSLLETGESLEETRR